LTARFAAGKLSPFLEEVMAISVIGIMAVDEIGNSAEEGSLDPNLPVFAAR